MEQGQQLGRAITDILVRLPLGLPSRLPTVAQVGLGLKRAHLIGGPDRQPGSSGLSGQVCLSLIQANQKGTSVGFLVPFWGLCQRLHGWCKWLRL